MDGSGKFLVILAILIVIGLIARDEKIAVLMIISFLAGVIVTVIFKHKEEMDEFKKKLEKAEWEEKQKAIKKGEN